MSPTMKKPRKKLPPGHPARYKNPRETFHLPADLLQAMIRFIEAQEVKPDKSEVMRVALREFLAKRGFLDS